MCRYSPAGTKRIVTDISSVNHSPFHPGSTTNCRLQLVVMKLAGTWCPWSPWCSWWRSRILVQSYSSTQNWLSKHNSHHPSLLLQPVKYLRELCFSVLYIHLSRLLSFREALMSQLYTCNDQLCEDDQDLDGLDEVIEHLRTKHKLAFIQRPNKLGTSDGHGHVWYCFQCETNAGKDHRSFQSDAAMWDHLNDCHDYQLPTITFEQ
jgi:hypothetical protein